MKIYLNFTQEEIFQAMEQYLQGRWGVAYSKSPTFLRTNIRETRIGCHVDISLSLAPRRNEPEGKVAQTSACLVEITTHFARCWAVIGLLFPLAMTFSLVGLTLLIAYFFGSLAKAFELAESVLLGAVAILAFLSIAGPVGEGIYKKRKEVLQDISKFLKSHRPKANE